MKDGRRGFLGGIAAAGAVVATTNPVAAALKGSSFTAQVPAELREGLADGSTTMRVSLVELVKGRRVPCTDHPALDLILHGNFDSPGINDALTADPVKWETTRIMTVEGIRIFGGTVGGRPFQNFAWFQSPVQLNSISILTVSYTLRFGQDIMSEENRHRPLRQLCDESERQA